MEDITPTRVFDLLPHNLAAFPKPDFLNRKVEGNWVPTSTQQLYDDSHRFSLGLLQLGYNTDDKIAIVSTNRPEWCVADFGIQHIGAVSVPVYPTISSEDYRFIFTDAGVKAVIVGSEDILHRVQAAIKDMSNAPVLYSFDALDGTTHWHKILDAGTGKDFSTLDNYKAAITPANLVTLIYTSGTTGTPKGVMLSHNNLVSQFLSCQVPMPVNSNQKALSFLPMCHIYERTVVYIYMQAGVSIYFATSIETVAAELKEVKPHIFTTVPRLLEKVYDRIVAIGYGLTGIKRALFFWAMDIGNRFEPGMPRSGWYNLQLAIARKLVFSKWREALGGNVMCVVIGSAALQPRLGRIFWAAGIVTMEGYGLTETSPVISVNRITEDGNRVGTVGTLLDNVQVSFAADGEILCKGPNVMMGYYKRPDLTAETIDADGWLHTGDIGTMVEGRFLKITDRKKEMFKTSGGKYIAPQGIENKLKEILLVENAMVVGDGMKFPSALLLPNKDALKDWCKIKGINYTTDQEMYLNPLVIDKFQKEIDTQNQSLGQVERIKKFRLVNDIWTVENNTLTPTLKLKRKVLLARYAPIIEDIYAKADQESRKAGGAHL